MTPVRAKGRLLGSSTAGMSVLLVIYVILGVLYSLLTPLWEAPDEPEHFWYIRYLATEGALPSQPLPSVQLNPRREESRQPPLYYLLATATTFWIDTRNLANLKTNPHVTWQGAPEGKALILHTRDESYPYQYVALAAHLVRLLSVLLGAATLLVTYATARELFPHRPHLALAAAALNALIPGFLFLHGTVNNDNLVALLTNLAILILVRLARRGASTRTFLLLGLVMGLGLLSKQNALYLAPLALAAFLLLRWRRPQFPLLPACLLTFGTSLLVAGWWYVRNAFFYQDTFRGDLFLTPEAGQRAAEGLVSLRPFALLLSLFQSFWGVYGWQNVYMPPPIYLLLALLSLLALAGLSRLLVASKGTLLKENIGLAIVFSWVVLVLGLTLVRDLVTYARWGEGIDHGRYLYPAISGIAVLFSAGLARLPRVGEGWALPLGLGGGLGLLSVIVPFFFIAPAYTPPLPVHTAFDMARIQYPVATTFENGIRLLGYDITKAPRRPGDPLEITLYWQTEQPLKATYVAFVKALNRQQESVAGDDRPPGGDWFPLGYPSPLWQPGEVIEDKRLIPLDPQTPPGRYTVNVGLYSLNPFQQVRPQRGGDDKGAVTLSAFKLSPPPDKETPPTPLAANFGEELHLEGYSLSPTAPKSGQPLPLTLYWRTSRPMSRDYTISVQMLDKEGKLVAQKDGEPWEGSYPTSLWEAGERVVDRRTLATDALPPGEYTIALVVYHYPTLERLPVSLKGDKPSGNALPLTRLTLSN